eukprot:m.239199 g.239199  ORF g.239199 m.239199 type:complete len:861 (-) comp15817_c0_seq1:1074-3656(-)
MALPTLFCSTGGRIKMLLACWWLDYRSCAQSLWTINRHGSTSKNINHRLWEDRIHQGVMPTFLGAVLITAVIAKLPAMKHYENQEYLALKMGELGSGRPEGVDPEFDCAWRGYAYEYAVQVQPWLVSDPTKLSQLYDALQLGPLCKQPPPSLNVSKAKARPATKATKDVVTFFVDAANGKDNQPYSPSAGGITQPFKSVASAVLAVRTVRSTMQGPATIFLRGNAVHYLSETIQLGPGDSQLTIAAYNNEPVVVSGGVHISNLKWTSGPAGSFIADLSDINLPAGVPAMQYGAPSARSRATLARYPNANPELDLFPVGYVTAKTQWRPPLYRGEPCDPKTQCGTSVNVTHVTPDSEWHGMYQNWTTGVGGACDVYDPPRSPWCSGQFYLERQFPEMHTRHPSGIYGDAHLPNIPYSAPSGSIVHAWRPGHWYTWMFEVDDYHVNTTQGSTVWSIQQNQNNVYSKVSVPGQDTSEVKFLGTFTSETECWQACNTSKKGLCTDWTWHHNDFGGAFSGQCYFTVGGDWDPKAQPKVTSARGPYNASGYFEFGAGGNQGGEGNENAGEWYIEGNLEDLDDLNEFWWDDVSRQLHYIPNGTAPPSDIVVPTLINIIEVIGSQAAPVTNVSFVGLTITANRPSFMEPRSNPSGGDWSLERMGAIFLEGTECVSISNSTFERLDSNAVFLSGYNQHASITQNNFRWLGQNAIASWGRPIDNDATNGDFPRYTIVEGNFIFNIGIQQKQSSFYFQAETAQAVIRNNVGLLPHMLCSSMHLRRTRSFRSASIFHVPLSTSMTEWAVARTCLLTCSSTPAAKVLIMGPSTVGIGYHTLRLCETERRPQFLPSTTSITTLSWQTLRLTVGA